MSSQWLEGVFTEQLAFQRLLGEDLKTASEADRVRLVKEYVLAATDELHEILRETSWKPWASGTRFNKSEIQNELVDLFCFFTNLCLVAELSPAVLVSKYYAKLFTNIERQRLGYSDGDKCPDCGLELAKHGTIHHEG